MIRSLLTTTSWALRLPLLVLVLLVAGCGSSSQEFVFTGANAPASSESGALTFRFFKAQSAVEVPSSTTQIRFEFFTGLNGTGQPSQTPQLRPFAEQITISPVLNTSRSVVITSLSSQGVPQSTITSNVIVSSGQTVNVDLGAATVRPVTLRSLGVQPSTSTLEVGRTQTFTATASYSNGDTIQASGASWTSSAPTIASIQADSGLATALSLGQTTIEVSLNGIEAQSTLTVVVNAENQSPSVTFNSGIVSLNQDSTPEPIFFGVNVTDDQAQLTGGQLQLSTSGVNTDVVLNTTSSTSIGNVSGDGSNSISVNLSTQATPANIESFLLGIKVSSPTGNSVGSGRLNLSLSDGMGGNNSTAIPGAAYVVLGASAGLYRVPSEFATIQAAVDAADVDATAGAVILVSEGVYDESVFIANTEGLTGLQLLGPNLGVSAGAQALGLSSPERVNEASVTSIATLPPEVNIDGFTVTGGANNGLSLGRVSDNNTVANNVFLASNPGVTDGLRFFGTSPPMNLRVTGNSFRNWQTGAFLGSTDNGVMEDLTVRGNIFENNDIGLYIQRTLRASVSGNSFVNNTGPDSDDENWHLGVKIQGSSAILTGEVAGNDFAGEGIISLFTGLNLILEGNFWGGGAPDAALLLPSNGIDVDPFSATRFTNYPRP